MSLCIRWLNSGKDEVEKMSTEETEASKVPVADTVVTMKDNDVKKNGKKVEAGPSMEKEKVA